MPKVNKTQPTFDSGELSKTVQGRVDIAERYDHGLNLCQNYIPIVQGPLIRRPGTKFVTNPKDASKPPALIPFQFSASQNYMLEFGDRYVRFYTREGQIITGSTTQYQLTGRCNLQPAFNVGTSFPQIYTYNATRIKPYPLLGENRLFAQSTAIAPGSVLELISPYQWPDVNDIKFVQKQDVMYLTHPNYPTTKLERHSHTEWTFKPIMFVDGPYLPYNSYQSLGDNTQMELDIAPLDFNTGPLFTCSSVFKTGSSATITICTKERHNFISGQKVTVLNVLGTTEANNALVIGSSTITACVAWTVNALDFFNIELIDSTFTNAWISGGKVYPALFQMNSTGSWADCNQSTNSVRTIAFLDNTGKRYGGRITSILGAHHAVVAWDLELPQPAFGPSQSSKVWQLGSYNTLNGFPSAVCLHQDRLGLAGHPNIPQQIDLSKIGQYENFAASGSNLQVNSDNALQFSLSSEDVNQIKWMKSNSQGLLAGTASSEWSIAPSNQQQALSPTSINANQVSYYGSADADAVKSGLSIIHVQRAQRKTRELVYFWQVGSFKSTNLSELSEHITLPAIFKLAVQKETYPIVWGLKTDGQLVSMSYSRDEANVKAGWAKHVLGGRSDSSGTPPIVKSMAVIPSGDGTFDELWLSTTRFINGTSVGTIEYMTKPFDDYTPQYNAYHLDCGGTYDVPIAAQNVSIGSTCIVTAANHGLTNSSTIRFYNVYGLNRTTTDVNGVVTTSSQLNSQTFMVASSSTNSFKIMDFLGNDINTNSSSIYVGSAVVRKLVTTITGFNWLGGEEVGVIADGGIHANTSIIQSGGMLVLSYPAAIVSVGYPYNSDAQMLRSKDGSAQGTSIGSTRRCNRVAFMLHNVGDFSFGPNFSRLIPAEFSRADSNLADNPVPLFDGIYRDGIESSYGFDDTICFRQTSGLPGMIQAITRFIDEQDV